MYTDFRDTLLVLATEEDSPSDAARVLALQEKRLGLSILEAEDLAVATDVQLTLTQRQSVSIESMNPNRSNPIMPWTVSIHHNQSTSIHQELSTIG